MTWQRPAGCDAAHCVEVTTTDDGCHVLMRDSKLANSPTLVWTRAEWAGLLTTVLDGELPSHVHWNPDGVLITQPDVHGVTTSLRFDMGEWEEFAIAVARGEFDLSRFDTDRTYRAGYQAAVARVRAFADAWYRSTGMSGPAGELAELCDELERFGPSGQATGAGQ